MSTHNNPSFHQGDEIAPGLGHGPISQAAFEIYTAAAIADPKAPSEGIFFTQCAARGAADMGRPHDALRLLLSAALDEADALLTIGDDAWPLSDEDAARLRDVRTAIRTAQLSLR